MPVIGSGREREVMRSMEIRIESVELSVVEVGLVILLPLSVVIRLLPFVIELDDLFARLVRDLERDRETERDKDRERERVRW
jgi:hypothetical protein